MNSRQKSLRQVFFLSLIDLLSAAFTAQDSENRSSLSPLLVAFCILFLTRKHWTRGSYYPHCYGFGPVCCPPLWGIWHGIEMIATSRLVAAKVELYHCDWGRFDLPPLGLRCSRLFEGRTSSATCCVISVLRVSANQSIREFPTV